MDREDRPDIEILRARAKRRLSHPVSGMGFVEDARLFKIVEEAIRIKEHNEFLKQFGERGKWFEDHGCSKQVDDLLEIDLESLYSLREETYRRIMGSKDPLASEVKLQLVKKRTDLHDGRSNSRAQVTFKR